MRAWWLVAALCAGCGDAIDDGAAGGHCFPNGTCNAGLACSNDRCVPIDAALTDAADTLGDGAIDAPPDAPPVCSDMNEPNDTLGTATATGIEGMANTRTFAAMICPTTDKDHYVLMLSGVTSNDLELLVDSNNTVVQGSILNSNGTPIANASPTSSTRRRALAPNLPSGTYYVAAYTSPGASLTYSLTVTVTNGL